MTDSWIDFGSHKLDEELLGFLVRQWFELPASWVPCEYLKSVASLLDRSVNCFVNRPRYGEMRPDLRVEPTPAREKR
jgi:hypothetical protein